MRFRSGPCNAYSQLTLVEAPTLFLEFHGTAARAGGQVESFAEIAQSEGGGDFRWAERPDERTKLWQASHDAYWAARGLHPGAEVVTTDVCVPILALAACVGETRADIERTGLLAPIIGHVGDGNFHVMPLFDASSTQDRRAVQGFLDRLVERALRMDGTISGKHGVGQGKIRYPRSMGPASR
jgi:D-lactate dehydrogenase (cytochrome)